VGLQVGLRRLQVLDPVADLERHVVEAHRVAGRGRRPLTDPQDREIVVVATRREENHPVGEPADLPEPQDVPVEPGGALEIPDLEDHVADGLDPDRHGP